MDFFVRDVDSLVPVEVKANDGATASLNHLIPLFPCLPFETVLERKTGNMKGTL